MHCFALTRNALPYTLRLYSMQNNHKLLLYIFYLCKHTSHQTGLSAIVIFCKVIYHEITSYVQGQKLAAEIRDTYKLWPFHHHFNKCLLFVNWPFIKNNQANLDDDTIILIQENAFENIVCRMGHFIQASMCCLWCQAPVWKYHFIPITSF